MTENQQLREGCENWLKAALTLLRGKPLWPMTAMEVVPADNETGFRRIRYVKRPDYWGLVTDHTGELADMAETEVVFGIIAASDKLSAALLADLTDLDGSLLPRAVQSHVFVWRYLAKFAIEHTSVSQGLDFDQNAFADIYEKFEQYIYRPQSIVTTWLVQFKNLATEIDRIDLGAGIRLRRAAEDEQVEAIKALAPPWGITLPDPYVPEILLEVEERLAGRTAVPDQRAPIASMNPVLLALRLIRPEAVIEDSVWFRANQPFLPTQDSRTPFLLPVNTLMGPPYVITEAVGNELSQMWDKTRKPVADPALDLALTRFSDAQARTTHVDQLIDYWIALESLFSKREEQEISYRAPLRIARFVGESKAERLQLFKDVRGSYGLRSAVVHGGDLQKKLPTLPGVTEATGATLRRALRRCVERGGPPVVADLDEELLA